MHYLMSTEELKNETTFAKMEEYQKLRRIIESNGTVPVEFPEQEKETDDVFVVKTLLKLLKPVENQEVKE